MRAQTLEKSNAKTQRLHLPVEGMGMMDILEISQEPGGNGYIVEYSDEEEKVIQKLLPPETIVFNMD